MNKIGSQQRLELITYLRHRTFIRIDLSRQWKARQACRALHATTQTQSIS